MGKTMKIKKSKNNSRKKIIWGSLWNYWHPPSRMKTERCYSSTWDSIVLRCFTVGVQSFFRPSEPRPEERKKVNFWKEPQRRPYTIINFPPSQNCHSLRAFSQFWEQGRICRWINDWSQSRRRKSRQAANVQKEIFEEQVKNGFVF